MRPIGKIVSAIAVVATLAMAGSALAEVITWNTTSGAACAPTFTCNGAERSFLGSDGSTVVTAKAWSLNDVTGVIDSAFLGAYSGGLGVTNTDGDSHTVDNGGNTDFVAFFFSEEVDINSVFLSTFGDTDMTAWIGTVPGSPNFSGQDFDDLDFNYGDSFDNFGGDVNRVADFGGDAEQGNLLVVAALRDSTGYTDLFKIKALYAESFATEPDDPPPSNTVAGPSSLLVFGPAVFAFAMMRRRRARKETERAVDEIDDSEDAAA
jgi:hypothetical protein